ncbi:hypothetical protein CAPTEDRAFT_218479 [Capitella teleta]|uniref:Uncharacterized protein n=1 Tax=Capitella teleta TaxID=283909 RepID=R7VM19_CAPTE|nr:hypothetical protein CAPTEDRAFT_218479 [Capitella teleta]|eukprot:ELU18751.1 hypothetical protein CAPTEDRAFT_218479 [Capitella teleta]
MVHLESPNCNSQRIQRVKRINTIEQGRLQHKITLLEKERIRAIRLHNQDVRMINLTMEFISSNTGHSPEGWSPDYCPTEEQRRALASCFLYGDRLNSRRFGKNRNFDTIAPSPETRRRGSVDGDEASPNGSNVRVRPHSSPAKRKGQSPASSGTTTPRPHTARDIPTASPRTGFSRSRCSSIASTSTRSSLRSPVRHKLPKKPEGVGDIPVNRRESNSGESLLSISQSRSQLIEAKRNRMMSLNSSWSGSFGNAKQNQVLEERKNEARQHVSLVNERVHLFNKKCSVAWA